MKVFHIRQNLKSGRISGGFVKKMPDFGRSRSRTPVQP